MLAAFKRNMFSPPKYLSLFLEDNSRPPLKSKHVSVKFTGMHKSQKYAEISSSREHFAMCTSVSRQCRDSYSRWGEKSCANDTVQQNICTFSFGKIPRHWLANWRVFVRPVIFQTRSPQCTKLHSHFIQIEKGQKMQLKVWKNSFRGTDLSLSAQDESRNTSVSIPLDEHDCLFA